MDDVTQFAETFRRFMDAVSAAAPVPQRSPLTELLRNHLDAEPETLAVVSETFAPWDHVNAQIALTAYLEEGGRSHELIGLTGQARHFESFSDLFMGYGPTIGVAAPDYVNLPTGVDETVACVQFGVFLIRDGDWSLAVLMRGASHFGPQEQFGLEVLSSDQERARAFLNRIRQLMVEHSVFRRQVISFGEPHMGYAGVGPVVFKPRPDVARDEIVLPDRTLELVERQVLGIAQHRERLRASGLHVKRGLLLYGPPGNGKTLTIRYLLNKTPEHTVLLLTGGALHMLRPACALARMLQPSIVVLEDVDLVAEERGHFEEFGSSSGSVLFDLLNEMEGMAEDADVAFVLTSNRADMLEPALAARPGRVDLAIEITRPDSEARRQLIDLYGRGLDLRITDLEPTIERTEGVAASFIRELMRKAALLAVEPEGAGAIAISDEHLRMALDELLDEQSALTRTLLGGEPAPPRRGAEWLIREHPPASSSMSVDFDE